MAHDIYNDNGLIVTAFCGKDGDASIQLTINHEYVSLDSCNALELCQAIICRLTRKEGYRATD